MMLLDQITPLILTWNEEANIGRCLQKLSWAKHIMIVDSFSTDKTLEITGKYFNVEVLQRKFDNFAEQANSGINRVKSDWVLSIDADYILSDELIEEVKRIGLSSSVDGYFAPFKYCVSGKPLRSTLLPPREVLFRKGKAQYIQDGHAHKLVNPGRSECFKNFIYHDDRKPFSRWWLAQKKYAELEVGKLSRIRFIDLGFADKLRKMVFIAPPAVFIYCFFWKGLVWDGLSGLVYSVQRCLAEFLLSVVIIKKWIEKFLNRTF